MVTWRAKTRRLLPVLLAVLIPSCGAPDNPTWTIPPGWEDFDPAPCALAEPVDLLGFDQTYEWVESGDWTQDKGFYLLTLLAGEPELRDAVAGEPELAEVAAAQRAGLATAAADCDGDCACVGAALDLEAEQDRILEALRQRFDGSSQDADLVAAHLRPSGRFHRYATLEGDELLTRAWEETVAGLIGAFQRFCGDLGGGVAAEVTAVAAVADEDALFFEPLLTLTRAMMEALGKDEAGRYEPLENGENRAAFERMGQIRWSAYPYSLILVPGMGPSEPDVPLAPLSMDRCDLAVERFHAGLAPFVLTSGGHVHPDQTPYSEAVEMKRYLMEVHGLAEEHLLIDPHARHTTTNLRNAARLVLRYGLPPDKPLLVTSDLIQSAYITVLGSRCDEELHYRPWRLLESLTENDSCLLVGPVSLHAAPSDPLDP